MPMTLPFDLDKYTWATKPAAAVSGKLIRITDVGLAPGAVFAWDGARWVPNGPQILSRSAVAAILPSSGSSNASGQITHTTALPVQPTGTVKVSLPAGVVTAGSQGTGAGLYDAIYSSTTVCQLTGTGIVTANAAYTQVTTEVALATTTIPAGAMGLHGAIDPRAAWTTVNSANNKIFRERLGGIAGTTFLASTQTAIVSASDERRIRNQASASLQLGSFPLAGVGGFNTSGNGLPRGAVDTSVAQDLVSSVQLAVATEYIILETSEVWLLQ